MEKSIDLPKSRSAEPSRREELATTAGTNLLWLTIFESISDEVRLENPSEFLDLISPRLGASLQDVDDALKALTELGLVERTESGYRRKQASVNIGLRNSAAAEVVMSQQFLNVVSDETPHQLCNYVARLNYDRMLAMMSEVREVVFKHALEQEKEDAVSVKSDGVYAISLGSAYCSRLPKGQEGRA